MRQHPSTNIPHMNATGWNEYAMIPVIHVSLWEQISIIASNDNGKLAIIEARQSHLRKSQFCQIYMKNFPK